MVAAPQVSSSYVVQGRTVVIPSLVRDASSGVAIFMVPHAAAQRLVDHDALEVVEMAPGEAQLILGFVDYRDNDLGDYNEVMIVFMVRPRGTSLGEGTYIYKLPVNQAFTCEAGSKIWGFPKTVDEIDIQYQDSGATCTLTMGGQPVFTLRVPRVAMRGEAQPDMEMVTYTYKDGAPYAVPFTSGGHGTSMSMGNDGVELALGTHPIALELRALGLPKAAVMSTWTEHMSGSFGAPQPIEPLAAPTPA